MPQRGLMDLPTQELPLRTGLSFTPVHRLVLTGRQYVIPFILRSEDVQQPLIEAINYTRAISWNVDHMTIRDPLIARIKTTLIKFDREFHKLFHDLNKFLHYTLNTDPNRFHFRGKRSHAGRKAPNARNLRKFRQHRPRRGLFDAFGSLSNVLFGTATQAQIDAVHKRLTSLEAITEEESVMLNLHSSTINASINEMHRMHTALQILSAAANTSNKMLAHFSAKTLNLEKEALLEQALLDLDFTIAYIGDYVLDLKVGL